jgi:hypothetical protein
VYQSYWSFAAERQDIFFRRLVGAQFPWTRDPILAEYKFTNAYRASDRVSQFLIRNVIYSFDQSVTEVFFRTILFKLFNKIETWNLLVGKLGLISCSEFRVSNYLRALDAIRAEGHSLYSGAYIMPAAGRKSKGACKHETHLRLLDQMLRDEIPARLVDAASMADAYKLLLGYSGFGPFLAYQFLIDLNYSPHLRFSENEFVVPGPGARDGIGKCFPGREGWSEADIIRWVTEHQQIEFSNRGLNFQSLWGRSLHLIDCQNLFCEVDKYARVAHPNVQSRSNRIRIKRRFLPSPRTIDYWYPPKWAIDESLVRSSLRNGSQPAPRSAISDARRSGSPVVIA